MKIRVTFLMFLAIFIIGCSDSKKETQTTSKTTETQKRVIEEEDNKVVLAKLDGTPVEATLSGENRIKDFTFSNAQGKSVVAVYWSTTCPPCIAEIPHLIEFQEKYKDSVKILGVLVEDKTKEEVAEFVKYHGITYDILYGEGNYDLADAMGGVRGIPAMYLFNKDGSLHKNFVGLVPPEMLEAEIKKMI